MHRIDHATRAVDLHGAGRDGFTEGDPVAGEAPTVVTANYLNAVQEELARAVEAFGVTLDPANHGQLAAALGTWPANRAMVRTDLADSRGTFVHADKGTPGWDEVPGRPEWVPDDSDASAAFDIMRAHSSTGRLTFSFMCGSTLPYQCTVHSVRAWVQQALDYAPGARMTLQLSRIEDTFAPTVIDTVEAGGGTGWQAIERTGLSLDLVGTSTLVFPAGQPLGLKVTLRAGNTPAPVNDLCTFVEVRYTTVIL